MGQRAADGGRIASVKIHDEVLDGVVGQGQWCLCFQRCTYNYDDGSKEGGFRFIWRRPDGTLQAARGQARIPNATALQPLISAAHTAGWY